MLITKKSFGLAYTKEMIVNNFEDTEIVEQIYKGYYGPYFKDLSRLSRADMVRIFKNIWDRIKVIFKTQALDGIGE